MTYAIIIWIIAIFSIVWIISRGYLSRRIISTQSNQKMDLEYIQTFAKKSIVQTSLVILFVWWISFILLETMKLKILDYQSSLNNKIIGISSIGFVLIMMHFFNNFIIKKKYNVRLYNKNISIERTLCIIISLIYALIASYAVEAFIIIAT